ncbi:SdrD B-like domain-containing protein [Chloroflexus aggregans]|uniref:Conserved repeat domain protein n=1 Tax=Chloroflexus aggregans (strain MD-66 / DSM 9485) TaxID=326427 RepID=B8G7F5_CHLAD|nr:SdrD B-like domain-containing protein [Chloroflexus aggregans]ACL25990.1 conserved repeat domain protein [Chloroflexus aggregans DSM 9485]
MLTNIAALRRSFVSLLLVIAVASSGLQPTIAFANATVSVMLSTDFPIVDSGQWAVIKVDYSCSSVLNTPCENATVTAVIPPELAGAVGDVQALGAGTSPSYNPATRTVTWAFNAPLGAGDSGRLELRVRFPAGSTPDGTTATLRAEMRSTTAPPRLSNPLTITARAEPRAVATKTFVSGGAPDVPTTYQVQVCIPNSGLGALNLTNVQIVDTLPAGVTFVSASDGGTYNSSTNTVTWPSTSLTVPSSLCATRTVTVIFPSTTFSVGTEVRNVVDVTAQAGSVTLTLTDDDVRRIQPPTPGLGSSKNGPTTALIGDTVTYTLSAVNTGTTALTDVVITDPVPPELQVTRINVDGGNVSGIRVALEYTTNLNSTFTAVPGSPFTTTNCINIAPATGGGCSTLTLGVGEQITAIRWRYLDPLPFGFSATGHGFSAVVTASPVNAVIVNQATSEYTFNGYTSTRINETRTRIIEPGARAVVGKSVNPTIAYAGDTVEYTLTLQNNQIGTPAAALVNPVLADLLIESLQYVPGSWSVVSRPSGAPDPVFEAIDNYNGTGRMLLRWRWDSYSLPPGQSFTIRFQARINPATLAGTITNTASLASFANPPGQIFIDQCSQQNPDNYDFDGDGNISELICSSSITSLSLAAAATASSAKWVLGQLDTEWTRDPNVGQTTPGGMADYTLIITNTNSVALTNLVLIDILPWVGDVGVVRFNDPRGSAWQPYLAGPISVPDGATVYYSTTNNPCRNPDLGLTDVDGNPIDAPGCVDPQWSTVPPADITTVRSVRIDFGSRVLYPGDSVVVTWPMRAPVGGTPDEVAWNTFGYRAFTVNGDPLLAAEPPRVGIQRGAVLPPSYGNYVWLDANLNGVQDTGEVGVNGARIDFYQDNDGITGPSTGDRWVGYTISGPDNDGNPGFYLFSDPLDIPLGDYYIRVTPPAGYGFTTPNVGANDAIDSDIEPATRYSAVTGLTSGENDDTWDVGLVTVTAVGNYVWIDRNGNGIQDEPPGDGVNGVTVRLYRSDNTPVATTVTADDFLGNPGYYLFSDLAPGSYYIEFVLPTGFSFTTADSGSSDEADSDANPTTGRTTVFTLAANQLDRSRDAGLIAPSGTLRLGNRVWYDRDNDDRYEPVNGETGINGVSLSLFRDFNNNGQPDPGEHVGNSVTMTVGGEAGYYQFTNLAAGDYIVVVDDSNFAPGGALFGMRTSSGNDPAPDPDNNVDHDDNGDLLGVIVRSLPITLSVGSEPVDDGDDANGNQTLDFGFIRGAALGDRVWFDTNNNGIQDAAEPGVPGVTVELLDGSGNPIDSDPSTTGIQPTITVTDGDGRYGFTDLNAGTYRVRFSGLPSGYSFTTPDQGSNDALDSDADATGLTTVITLAANQTDLRWDAGLVATPASLGNRVWNDLNYNGIQDTGEPGVSGVSVSLFRPGYDGVAGTADDELVATDTTDSSGNYSFTNLPPGRYFVQFGPPPTGYAITATDQGTDDAADSDADLTTRRTVLIDLAPGENDPDWDMGLFVFATIGDRVWSDTNNNGIQDTGEPGVSGVQVRLYRPGSSVPVAMTTTNSSGIYTFTNLIPDNYYVEFSLPGGYRASPRDQGGDDTLDSDADPVTRQTAATTLAPGENDPTWDFGIVPTASIGDRVWLDLNANGIQDANETAGVPGVQVVLYDGVGNVLNTTVTDVDGLYRFDNLLAGNYYLRFVVPASFVVSPQDQGTNDNADSDVNPTTLLTVPTTLSAGENDLRWDLGLYQLASIGDRVWHDLNGNGRQDGGEPGVPSVSVSLYQPGPDGLAGTADDVLVASTTTDSNGFYRFDNLTPGRYFVQFGATPGYSLLSPRDSTEATDETDSDVDANRRTPIVELVSSAVDLSLDMGVLNPASLGNYVWFDADVDGVQDATESGVQGVRVRLFTTGSATPVMTTTTDINGLYLFNNLLPGEYYVVFDQLPANRSLTRADQGSDDALDSDANPLDGRTGVIRLVSGDNNQTVDAGIFETITVGDRVWIDRNANGVQDTDETTGVPGVRVELLRDSDGAVLDVTYTDLTGLYQFTNLFPGTYRIRFSEIPTGYIRSPQDRGGDDTLDSDANSNFETAPFTPGSGNNLQYDLGLYQLARIGNYVWEDRNGNGRQDAGEPAISGVTVTLTGTTGAGGSVTLSQTTDVNGFYLFTDLVPGTYTVSVTAPSGYVFTAANQGDDLGDSDANAGGVMASTTLESGEEDLTWDAGLYRPASIGDRVWRDTNGNGVQDAGEAGIDGVNVTLNGTTGAGVVVNQTTTTAGGGLYSFTNLAPGTYQITVTAPSGEVFTYRDILASEVAGANDTNDSDADASGIMIATTLESGENDLTWDAGLVIPASLGDLVWEDLNGNGVQETGEPGFNNVTVALIGAGRDRTFGTADDTSATTTTNGSGSYSFTNLQPGLYRVRFTRPNGYGFTVGDAAVATDTTDSDVPGGVSATATTITVDLESGENDPTWDAGLYQLLSLGNRVWDDVNNNGLLDTGEDGIDGVTVRLYRDLDGDGDVNDSGETTPVATTTTGNGGYYLFSGLVQGDYLAEVVLPSGYVSSTGTNGSASGPYESAPDANTNNTDSDDNGTQSGSVVRSTVVQLRPSTEPTSETDPLPPAISDPARNENSNLTVDFGLFRPASLGNLVWFDRDANGVQDGGDETGVSEVQVQLFRDDDGTPGQSADDSLIASTTTDASGVYGFGYLIPANNYYLVFDLPTGYMRSLPDQGGNDATDSDPDRTSGATALITLVAGQNDQTWDAGLYQLVNLGNRVWNDVNNNGQLDDGESGIDGVTVNLYYDADRNGTIDPAENTPVATTTTSGGGFYAFANLDPGNYLVEIPASNFAAGGALGPIGTMPAFRSSTGTNGSATGPYEDAPDPDDNVDNDDNGTDDGSGNVQSALITLRSQDEPATDGDDNNGNLTVDFGFFRPLALGNFVWHDYNNNRAVNAGEPGINNVTVQLYRDVNSNGVYDPGTDTLVATTTTSGGGSYRFDNLIPGDYLVVIPEVNFSASGALRFFRSSDGGNADDGAGTLDPDNNVDNDDNGIGPNVGVVTGTSTDRVVSAAVTLSFADEPTTEDSDSNTNLTVDFGFYSLTVGNRVWLDVNNNGVVDGGETGVDGVTVQLLYDADGSDTINGLETTAVVTVTTSNGGRYFFGGLRDGGTYAVQVASNASLVSSTGINGMASGPYEPGLDPDADLTDNNDNGTQTGNSERSPVFAVRVGSLPTNEPDTTLPTGITNPAIDANSNLTIDFGLFDDARLGDRIWLDVNGDGIQDTGETTNIAGITITIYDATTNQPLDGDPVTSGIQPITRTSTTAATSYLFNRLITGSYYLVFSDIPAQYAISPLDQGTDNAVDSDVDPATLRTATVTFGTSNNNNLTWDLGLYPRLTLGNLVWYDTNDNGVVDSGESGIANVRVELYRDSNNNGQPDLSEFVTFTTTDANGNYLFTGLEQGDYIVVIPASNFVLGQPLYRHRSSTGANGAASGPYEPAPDPDNNADNDDNGTDQIGDDVVSGVITLNPSFEPATDGDDANGNLTLDFGFFEPLTLGDLVWNDLNNNGLFETGETGIDGVRVELYLDGNGNDQVDAGEFVAFTTTAGGGLYTFSDLIEGNYIVRIPASQFATGQPLAGFVSSTGTNGSANGPYEGTATPDPDNNLDNDDNGTTGTSGNVDSLPITLSRGNEPTNDGDGNNGNLTVDFGFFRHARLGDRVWHDVNANGLQEGGESGINNVTVELYSAGADGVIGGGDDVSVATTTTDSSGIYGFGYLIPGNYYVRFALPTGYTDVSPRDQGSDNAIDSDADPVNRQTVVITLAAGDNDPTWDMGVFNRASVGNFVWEDHDGDGVQDAGESGIDGVTVTLYRADGTTVATTTTAADGSYSFTGLVPGEYYVVFSNLPSGYVFTAADQGSDNTVDSDANPTTGRTANFTLTSGQTDTTWDAGAYRPASIGNYVWEDTNGNGVQETGESGVANVTVTLYRASDNSVAGTATTALDGSYSITNLVPGEYYIVFSNLPSGYVFTAADQGDNALDSDANQTTGRTANFTLVSGQSDLTWDAGLYQPASVGNYVWEDTNGNGVQDTGEAGVANVTVTLYRASDNSVAGTATTVLDGSYSITNLVPGEYYIVFSNLPSGYVFTAADQGDNALDSDANQTTGHTANFTLVSGQTDLTWDAGLFGAASIGDRVWEDLNGNGVQDAGELGVANVEVRLSGTTGVGATVNLTTTTTITGSYRFDNLAPGTYTVTVVRPSGYEFTAVNQGSDDAVDSDADPTSGAMSATVLVSGEEDLTWDAGLYRPASIGDRVWRDTNGNGVQDAGELGVANVEVRLSGMTGAGVSVNRTTFTDSDGLYRFDGLAPGEYAITVIAPPNDAFTVPNQGGDDALDSDADATGAMPITTLTSGEEDLTWDAGLFGAASIGDRVWEDLNGNGVQDAGEPGVVNVEVRLSGTTGAGVAVNLTTMTDSGGLYRFDNLAPGTYTVTVSRPSGYEFTAANQGADDAVDSDVTNSATGAMNATVLVSGEEDLTWDAGLYRPASIGDRVWEDVNGNGVQDTGEAGVANVTVTLYRASDNSVAGTATTVLDGSYSITNLVPGEYYIVFSNLPSGYVFTAADQGDNALDSDANQTTGRTANFTLVSGQSDLTWDAGLYRPASVGNFVWRDVNGNGVQDAGESGISGVTVTLTGTGPDGVFGTADDINRTVTTDSNGEYIFDNLPPSNYRLTFSGIPAELTFSPADQVGDDTADSDVITSGGVTDVFALTSGQSDLTRDAGLYPLLSLGNLVWIDTNNNGVFDSSESGADGVRVLLYRDSNGNGMWDADDPQVGTTWTDSNGNYRFTGLPQGNYFVVLPGRQFGVDGVWYGYRSSTGDFSLTAGPYEPAPNANNDLDNDDNGTRQADADSDFNIVSGLIELRPDSEPDTSADGDGRDSNLTIDFGIFQPAVVGDTVWSDRNGNGRQDAEEPGVANVRVTLYYVGTDGIANTADDTLVGTRLSDSDGFYEFTDLLPGDYYLVFSELPVGARFTAADQGADDTIDSDADPVTGVTAVFSIESGTITWDWDSGLLLPASVGDRVWLDTNGNGVQDSDESGIEGVTVRLTGTDIDGNTVDLTRVTDANGNYRFDNVQPGTYTITVTPPTGYMITAANRGSNDSTDSDIDSSGATDSFTVLGGDVVLTWDAGLYRPASIGNFVWEDVNGNGVQDAGESGIDGVMVTLNGTTGAGETVNLTTTTSSGGLYRFDNVQPGTYTITVTPPTGYVITAANRGSDDNTDSDIDPVTGATTTFALTSGATDLTWDAGLYQPATLGNRVWHDSNANGIAESGEEGVSGVTVRLYRADGTLVDTVVTDSNGRYLFTNLPPGSYYLEFELPSGWVFSPPMQGGDRGQDSDVDPNTQRTAIFTIGYGETDLSWGAGIHQPAPPTAITLLSFTAERQTNGVLLRWVTGSERDTLGFVILRSASGNRADAVQLFTTPIPAQGSAGSGASYQWFDRTAQPDVSYRYWLVEIESGGGRNEFALHSPALQSTYRLLIPVILR